MKKLCVLIMLIAISGCTTYRYKDNINKNFDMTKLQSYVGKESRIVKMNYGTPDFEDEKMIVYLINKIQHASLVFPLSLHSPGKVIFHIKDDKVIRVENTFDKVESQQETSSQAAIN